MARILPIGENQSFSNKKQIKPIKNGVSLPLTTETANKLVKYSQANLNANFMTQQISFTSRTSKIVEQFAMKDLYENQVNGAVKIDTIESDYKGRYYDKLADQTIITLDKEKDFIIHHEPGVSTELLIDNVKQNLVDGKYRAAGYAPETTSVHILNDIQGAAINLLYEDVAEFKLEYGQKAYDKLKNGNEKITPETLEKSYKELVNKLDPKINEKFYKDIKDVFQMLSESTEGRGIVFINDFGKLNASIEALQVGKARNFFKNYDNLSFVTFVRASREEIEKTKKATQGAQTNLNDILPMPFKGVRILEMKELSIKDTEQLFKKNPEIIESALGRFNNSTTLKLSPNAIPLLIETAAKKVDTPLPNGALELLHDVAANTLINTKDPYKRINRTNARIMIGEKQILEHIKENGILTQKAEENRKLIPVEGIKTRMKDIIGNRSAKGKLEDLMQFIKDPDGFVKMGRDAIGGACLAGPPGTGKTELMRAVAGECGVPFFALNGSDFGTTFINSGANKVNEVYDGILDYLRKTGQRIAILGIDEGEPVIRKRSGGEQGAEDAKMTGAMIARTDGFSSKDSYYKVITMVTTNRADIIDPALTDRPSRIGKPIIMDILHRKDERYELLQLKAKKRPFANEAEKAQLLDHLADISEDLNGDQITKTLDNATKLALKTKERVIKKEHIVEGLFTEIFGEISEKDATIQERLETCQHEAGHAEMVANVKGDNLIAISNEPRGNALAFVYHGRKEQDVYFENLVDSIAVSLGGGEAEKFTKINHGAGVSQDYKNISRYIDSGIKKYGIGIHTPPVSFFTDEGKELTAFSETYKKEIAKDTKIYLESGLRTIQNTLKFGKDFIMNRYMKEIREAVERGKNGKNYLGHEYLAFRQQWLDETGKTKAEPVLHKALDIIKSIAQTDKKWFDATRLDVPFKKLEILDKQPDLDARNIFNDGIDAIMDIVNKIDWKNAGEARAQDLIKHLEQIENMALSPREWVIKGEVEKTTAKLKFGVEQIVLSARGETKKTITSMIKNILYKI